MTLKKIFYVSIIALLSLNILLLMKLTQTKDHLKLLISKVNKTGANNELSNKIKSCTIFSFNQEGKLFPNQMKVLKWDSKPIKLNEIVNNQTTIFFRIPSNSCNICIQNQINILNNYSELINGNLFLLITMDYKLFELKYGGDFSKYKIFTIPLELENQLDEINYPYFFISEQGEMKNIFYPIREMPDLTRSYLRMAVRKLHNNS